ncbi:MAG TPA: OmpA family protein, partial [Flavisolibacter sp.]|nr:OmpA family protein [Flavisolibacter sp.]
PIVNKDYHLVKKNDLLSLSTSLKLIYMKAYLLLTFLLIFSLAGNAQLLKRLGDRAKQKMEQKANEKVDKTVDDATSAKTTDKGQKKEDEKTEGKTSATETAEASSSQPAEIKSYAKYDFVPGNQIIFEDNLPRETEGEFPSLFNTTKGQVQVSDIKGQKVIQSFGCSDLIPRIKDGEKGKDYLPEQFTIEYDAYFPNEWGGKGYWWHDVYFYDESDKNHYTYTDQVPKRITIDQKTAKYEEFSSDVPAQFMHGGWNHIAIAVNKNMLKVYVNQNRLINTPSFTGNPKAITIDLRPNGCSNEAMVLIKNLRIAEGGIDLYKRATVEGRFVARGINFDYNKATLRPESMGEINRITKLMNDNPALKFEIGGHTDTDGDDAYNQKLSQERADAVKSQLVSAGIDASRLTTKGYGETKPLNDNTSPEGKANNRRVEFVKL